MRERRITYKTEGEAPYTLEERLRMLTDLLARFEAPDASEDALGTEMSSQYGYYIYGPLIDDFIAAAVIMGWQRNDIDWVAWQRTREAERIFSDQFFIQVAFPQELANYTTCLIGKERFTTGILARAFTQGDLTEIVRRGLQLETERQKKERGGFFTRLFLRGSRESER